MAHAVDRPTPRATDWLGLIRSEYREIPGLHSTLDQARRLWHLDDRTTQAIFRALVEASCLRQTDTGGYVRADAN